MYAVLRIHKSATSNMYTYLHIVLFLVVVMNVAKPYRVPALFVLENRVKSKTGSVEKKNENVNIFMYIDLYIVTNKTYLRTKINAITRSR